MAVCEYHDSDALLSELGDSFLQGFEDALCQVKKVYPDLDVSNIKMEDQVETSILPVTSDDTDDLFDEADGQGEGESSRQPSNPSQSNTRTLQPSHSYLHVFTYFCCAFFVFGEQFLSVMDNV